jgi:hypothetical protein
MITLVEQAILIYALQKDWQSVLGLNAEQLIDCGIDYYIAGSFDNPTKTMVDDIYLTLKS